MKVYLAAQYPRRAEIASLVSVLGDAGIEVRSRWLKEPISPTSTLWDTSGSYNRNAAIVDLEDVEACDTLVLFSEDPLVGVPRGGRHVEFGYALAKGKRVIVVGGHENVFHFIPAVVHYSTFDSFLEGERIDNAAVAD